MTEAERRFRPALAQLCEDQQELIRDLEAGFESRAAVLVWLQRVAVRTLGRLPDEWYRAVANRPDVLDDMAGDGEARRQQRTLVADGALQRAFGEAYHSLRRQAHEYIDDEHGGDPPDPNEQEFVAMRPSLTEADALQRSVVASGLEGFDTRAGIREWVSDARDASEGELGANFGALCLHDPAGLDPLLGAHGPRASLLARETLLGRHVLPAFNAGVRELHSTAGETARERSTGLSVPQG